MILNVVNPKSTLEAYDEICDDECKSENDKRIALIYFFVIIAASALSIRAFKSTSLRKK